MNTQLSAPSNRRRILWLLLPAGMLSAIAVFLALRPASVEDTLASARQALLGGEFQKAEQLAQEVLDVSDGNTDALLLAAKAAVADLRPDDALVWLDRIPDKPDDARQLAASLHLQLGHASEAENELQALLKSTPGDTSALRSLARLLTIEGRRLEAAPLWFQLVRSEQHVLEELLMLGNTEEDFIADEEIERLLAARPDDHIPMVNRARVALHDLNFDEAEQHLRRVLEQRPELLEAHAWLGFSLLQGRKFAALRVWDQQLPANAAEHPLIWTVKGDWAAQRQNPEGAIRCYWEAVRVDANLRVPMHRLAQTLAQEQHQQKAEPFLERAELLRQLRAIQSDLWSNRNNPGLVQRDRGIQTMLEAARINAALDRPAEAAGWYAILSSARPADPEFRSQYAIHREAAALLTTRNTPESNPALQVDLSMFSLPRTRNTTPVIATARTPQEPSTLRFTDRAENAGIDFSYFNDHDFNSKSPDNGMPIYQEVGGGVGAFDYDRDGWPDLVFSQGCRWPYQPEQESHRDRLFRNTGQSRFEETSSAARLADSGFGQGVASGDVDNDGFPDLYIANIGGNRLFRNNGDGTFSDMTVEAGLSGNEFTSSCVIADLNGDSIPDIYDVNYVDREGIERLCKTQEGYLRGCAPKEYEAAQDRLWLGNGDGTFADVTSSAGIKRPDGTGMGIVAGDLDGSGKISLFIANDGRPNFLLVNEADLGQPPRFHDNALIAGVAVNRDGKSQACMGIAAGDTDGNAQLDLFVTNFFDEYNTLYRQQSGQFLDASREARLQQPGLPFVGFGTQFVDADLDGWLDLVVTNGHIDDCRYRDNLFHMPPQAFHNQGGGVFADVSDEALADYGAQQYLGRGMARLDWNRDSREDVVITHLQHPAALLTNETPDAGHFLAVQFAGTSSARDAVSARVEVVANGRRVVRQLTAGDGYQACNERRVVIGLGTSTAIEHLVVTWPGGEPLALTPPAVDSEVLLIEGLPTPELLSTPRVGSEL
jgi:tetratricopeptide (TPR) repeat protein